VRADDQQRATQVTRRVEDGLGRIVGHQDLRHRLDPEVRERGREPLGGLPGLGISACRSTTSSSRTLASSMGPGLAHVLHRIDAGRRHAHDVEVAAQPPRQGRSDGQRPVGFTPEVEGDENALPHVNPPSPRI
jgi:hypothetical protein